MTKQTQPWRFDWAGRHGTAWGTVNACLTTVTLTSATHALGQLYPDAAASAPYVAAGVGAAGVIGSLGKAAFARVKIPVATVAYQATCWAGVGSWSAWMLANSDWSWSSWLTGIGTLTGGAIIAGITAGLGAQDKENDDPFTDSIDMQASRNKLARKLEERVLYLGGQDAKVKVLAIEYWDRKNGYSVQGKFLDAKFGMDELQRITSRLSTDLDLPEGCTVEVYRPEGGRRRDWVMDISTVNYLAKEQTYPTEITPLTINGGIPLGVRANGEEDGLYLRSRNVLEIGEPGSGKTNALHVTTAGIVRCVDAIACPVDLTGAGYPRPWVAPWEKGETNRPPLGLIADTPEKAEAFFRALLRIGYARKEHYQDLMAAHDDDKIPIGATVTDENGEEWIVPQIVPIVDEIAAITGRSSEYPQLKALIKQVMQELRASGIRVVLAGLRSTDDVITQDMEALCQSIVGLRMKDKKESGNTFGHEYAIDPADVPYEGSAQVRHGSGEQPFVERIYRMAPSQIRQVARVATDDVNGWVTDLDPISLMAANGRHPDGTPMRESAYMQKCDLDWWDRRWDGWGDKSQGDTQSFTPPAITPPTIPASRYSATEVLERTRATSDALDARLAQIRAERGEDEPVNLRELEVQRIIAEIDWTIPANWGAKAPTSWRERVQQLLIEAWPVGIGPKDLLADPDVSIHRDTLHEYLKKAHEGGEITKVAHGKYAICPDQQSS